MKIVVLNGSPLGKYLSITMKSIEFIQQSFPQHVLEIVNISSNIKNIESDERIFQEIIDKVKQADGVIWAFPVYILLVPSQYKRFIELIFEKEKHLTFKDKYAATFSTSIHFHDNIAHNYMHAICDDLDMKYVGYFSGERYGLLDKKERQTLISFAEYFFESIEQKSVMPKRFNPVPLNTIIYNPESTKNRIDIKNEKAVILVDTSDNDSNLNRMVNKFKDSIKGDIEVLNLKDINIKSGCVGCYHCGYKNECIHDDGFVKFYNTKVKTADIIIYASTIKDRYLTSRWKLVIDRSFFNNHVPVLTGKQIGIIISGPLEYIPNIREMLTAFIEWQQGNLVGIVTDEHSNSADIDALLESLAMVLARHSDKKYIISKMFYGVAGTRLLRDYVWGRFRFGLPADHEMYKKLGLYDFPHHDIKMRLMNFILYPLLKIEFFRKPFDKRINYEIVKPHIRILHKYEKSKKI